MRIRAELLIQEFQLRCIHRLIEHKRHAFDHSWWQFDEKNIKALAAYEPEVFPARIREPGFRRVPHSGIPL
jgi:hypothetical protein